MHVFPSLVRRGAGVVGRPEGPEESGPGCKPWDREISHPFHPPPPRGQGEARGAQSFASLGFYDNIGWVTAGTLLTGAST